MRDKISRRQPIQYRVLPRFFAVFFILALVAHTMPFAAAQIPESSSREPVSFDEAAGKTSARPESPSLILVPNGMAAVTSRANDGPTVRVVDISQFGSMWAIPANRAPSYISTTGQMPTMQSWTTSQFTDPSGEQTMRGLAISADGTRIYTGTSGYDGANKTPNIYLIGPSGNTPVRLATLPSYVANVSIRRGIAGLDLDETHNAVFASSYADGIIYRRDATTGANLGSFDPLTPYVLGDTNLPPYGERVVAVAYNKVENRLYYSIWGHDSLGGSSANSVRSVGLTALGAFDPPTDRLEFDLVGSLGPVADIEFNNAGNRMLLGEETIQELGGVVDINAHKARALEYTGGTGTWSIDPADYDGSGRKYGVGAFITQTNCRGGVAWAYSNITGSGIISGNENFVMFTGDALQGNTSGILVYGLQFTPSTGGGAGGGIASNSLIADLDYEVILSDKYIYGDVDIRRSLSTTSALVSLSGQVLNSSGTGLPGATVTLASSDGVVRSTITSPFGYYVFDQVSTNETYIITASAKRNRFTPQVIFLQGEMDDVNFTPNQQ